MIFRPALARAILRGHKTQTRRPVTDARCRYRVDSTYAVQPGHGNPEIGRIRILDVQSVRLGDVTFADARAEGFRTTNEFKAYWVSLHDPGWPPLERVFCPTCTADADFPADERSCPDPDCVDGEIRIRPYPTEAEAVARFKVRHADRPVWVIAFEVDHDADRFLSAGWPDYTMSPALAMPGEPPAVDEPTQERITKQAQERWKQEQAMRKADHDSRPLWERLRELEEQQRQGANVHRQLAAIRRRIDAAEARQRRSAA